MIQVRFQNGQVIRYENADALFIDQDGTRRIVDNKNDKQYAHIMPTTPAIIEFIKPDSVRDELWLIKETIPIQKNNTGGF